MLCVVLFRSAMLSSSALPLLDKAREELVENDYDHAEQSIRAALQVLFERRIAQFREQQQLSKAMSLAVELTQLRPSEASGYQWQGDLLAEQCCYSKAATIYSEGFAKTQVESLRVASEAATARHNVKIDPLRYLPPEIIPLIFSHVPQQRVRCLSVCKEWHQRLFMISSIWRNLHFYYRPSLRAVSMTGFRRVIGASLDTLTVTTKSGACAAFRLIRQSDYRYIRKLILKDSTRYKQSASLPPKFILTTICYALSSQYARASSDSNSK
ncbi:hypothetical protein BCR43DRAFT_382633 [Syncephalastrum racemosum]|uniref:F-box domain-containing protein n=1 Tax=Syncephalastrum racemosum TaxID=13706 RepID=A0A1X2H5C1_SYNRA|nr:hypothetical protein BCR43DRAFT_382633 [Syncephalastrum racemosum]